MENNRLWDFAKVPGMIALATASGFIGSVVGYWFYFLSWDSVAFRLLTPGDFSTLAVPIILAAVPLFLPTAILFWLARTGNRALDKLPESQRASRQLRTDSGDAVSLEGEDGRSRSLNQWSKVRSFFRKRLYFLFSTFIFTVNFFLFYAIFSGLLVSMEFTSIIAMGSFVSIIALTFTGMLALIALYYMVDQFLEFFLISIPNSVAERIVQSTIFIAIFSGVVSAMIAFQIQNFQRSLHLAKLSTAQECNADAAGITLSSSCLLHSLERGVIFYDARDGQIKFRYHQEGIVVSLRTPDRPAQYWGEHPWFAGAAAFNAATGTNFVPLLDIDRVRMRARFRFECRQKLSEETAGEVAREAIEECLKEASNAEEDG